jgi:hypothetical protein
MPYSADLLGVFADNHVGRAYLKHILNSKIEEKGNQPMKPGLLTSAVQNPNMQKALDQVISEWASVPENRAKLVKALPNLVGQ